MEFRLTYQGKLLAAQQDDVDSSARRIHKHNLRTHFHGQMQELWNTHNSLKNLATVVYAAAEEPAGATRLHQHARRHELHGVRWAPLVCDAYGLACSLNILFLRPEPKGKLYTGDLDNRIKTLFDALEIPDQKKNKLPEDFEAGIQPRPFFCLLENDRLITQFTVTSDRLLVPNVEPGTVHLVIEVKTSITDHDKAYGEFA
jgi:hypothetical protein